MFCDFFLICNQLLYESFTLLLLCLFTSEADQINETFLMLILTNLFFRDS